MGLVGIGVGLVSAVLRVGVGVVRWVSDCVLMHVRQMVSLSAWI